MEENFKKYQTIEMTERQYQVWQWVNRNWTVFDKIFGLFGWKINFYIDERGIIDPRKVGKSQTGL